MLEEKNKKIVNYYFTIIGFSLPGILGSLWSIILHGAGIVGYWRLWNGTITYRPSRDIAIVAACFASFAGAELISVVANQRGLSGLASSLATVVYLFFIPVYARLKISATDEIWSAAIIGATICCLGGAAISLFQLGWWGFSMRVEGGAGNSAIFANVLAIYGPLALAGLGSTNFNQQNSKKAKQLIALASILSISLLILSSARVLIFAGFLNFVLVIIFLRNYSKSAVNLKLIHILMSIILSISIVTIFSPNFYHRIIVTYQELASIRDNLNIGSLGERVVMWRSALKIFIESPVFGFGPDSIREVFQRLALKNTDSTIMSYSHFHNVFVTALMRGGLLEFISVSLILTVPFLLTFMPKIAPLIPEGKLIIRISSIAFAAAGAGGVVFGHDIIDAMFCYLIVTGFALRDCEKQA